MESGETTAERPLRNTNTCKTMLHYTTCQFLAIPHHVQTSTTHKCMHPQASRSCHTPHAHYKMQAATSHTSQNMLHVTCMLQCATAPKPQHITTQLGIIIQHMQTAAATSCKHTHHYTYGTICQIQKGAATVR